MRLKEWINVNANIFTQSDLRFLLKESFSKNKQNLFGKDIILDNRKIGFLNKVKSSYLKGMPIGYLLKKEEFFGLEFVVNPAVLIPRQDTEIITEKAIEVIKNNNLKNILDLCCGTANIAISIKKFFEQKMNLPAKKITEVHSFEARPAVLIGEGRRRINIVASDISQKALKVARNNVKAHGVNVKVVKSDLFNSFKNIKFDLIVSNPPYLKNSEIKGALLYEPRKALFGGKDGLSFLKKILLTAAKYLKANGFLIVEAGYNQKTALNAILEKTGKYEIIEWIKDYGGNFRGVILKIDADFRGSTHRAGVHPRIYPRASASKAKL
ncbi:MAG: peptide chain release factor N(5)-glutamine methyltransferase [Candidatus Omnitrophota bacterium]|jgi:release factor glutamine methyltransferase